MKLILVPTPIGNLEDITLRGIRTLQEVDAVVCEDTRVTLRLLSHLGIQKSLVSYHLNNEHKAVSGIVEQLKSGKTLALVTDAGTPGISDPGYLLVRACLHEGIEVECLPGPVAFVPALVASGLPCERFVFEGFLPHKKGRETRMKQIAAETRTVVLYESTHRILKTLEQLAVHCGPDRRCAVGRELTKMHEEMVRGTLSSVCQHLSTNETRGEFVLIIGAESSAEVSGEE
ncbi:MAG: 16S rRNA (cytidine(1402)-2'-O)-methyltransferase [Flavobacteriales bacterium]|nr:16S rRNA (cytidine(1402)-2'-O)-methyltransferase [Flavobacteriales bacterium]